MKSESLIRILAGTVVLTSVTLAHFVSQWWLLLAVFASLNLIQSAFTGFCPPEIVFRKLGLTKDGASFCNLAPKEKS
ncbi:MAG: DUF2892 domain-containing protein [Nibricoccus sp.]